jgi:hypothetical protein
MGCQAFGHVKGTTLPKSERIDTAWNPDPYGCWAKATQCRYLAGRADRCRLALRLKEGKTLADLSKVNGLVIPSIYRGPMRYCSAQFDGQDADAWNALLEFAEVALAEPGLARPDERDRCLPAVMKQSGPTWHPPVAGADTVIGVIDGACGFAHQRFRERADKKAAWTTRLAAYWDQQGKVDDVVGKAYWTRPDDLGYGRELSLDGLNDLFRSHLSEAKTVSAQAAAEREIYRQLKVDLPAVADWTHGTHVLDTAGGGPVDASAGDTVEAGYIRPVPKADVGSARLIYVQLPESALRDTSGRWMSALVLDGLRYIISRAGAQASIVVNLSLGSFAGPHDGSSMIEQAMDAMVEELNGRLTVVVAAGNAGRVFSDSDGTVRQVLAARDLGAAGTKEASAVLDLDVDEADGTETFVELWLPTSGTDATDLPGVHVELKPPENGTIEAAPGEVSCVADEQSGLALAQLVNLTDRGCYGARGRLPMALVAIGGTRNVGGVRASMGRWRITVTNLAPERVRLEAWVERRDVPGELSDERPQYGFHVEQPRGDRPPEGSTLGSLANGARTIVVLGAEFKADGAWELSDSSSRPAGKKPAGVRVRNSQRPRLERCYAAACEFAAAGFLTGSHKTLKGTSMATAWVTRAIAAGGLPKTRIAGNANGAPSPAPGSYIIELPPT